MLLLSQSNLLSANLLAIQKGTCGDFFLHPPILTLIPKKVSVGVFNEGGANLMWLEVPESLCLLLPILTMGLKNGFHKMHFLPPTHL